MKNLVFPILILMLGINLQAQTLDESSSSEIYTKQVGFNFTDFALRFISLNEGIGGTPDILVLYKKGNNEKKWRFGFGGMINWNKNPVNSPSSKSFNFNFNFGKEYHRMVAKKWIVYFGWEILTRTSLNKVTFTSSNPLVEPQEDSLLRFRLGGLALIGIQYNFNNRISLLTESSYTIISSYQKDENSREVYSIGSFYSPPISLILNYHF